MSELALNEVYAERLRTSKIVGIHLKVDYYRHDELVWSWVHHANESQMATLVDADPRYRPAEERGPDITSKCQDITACIQLPFTLIGIAWKWVDHLAISIGILFCIMFKAREYR